MIKSHEEFLDNSRLQSQDDASYALVSPTLPYLKGVAKLRNLQNEVSYVRVCVAEAWWYPKMQEELGVSMSFG